MDIIRQADRGDADAVARVFRQSRLFHLPYLPDLHTPEEDRAYLADVVFRKCEVWVATQDEEVVGFCAFRQEWVDHLYLLPKVTGRGIGGMLLGQAKMQSDLLQLWVFQRNLRAIEFYERQGFSRIRETDGSDCEEKLPDALYRWTRPLTV